MRSNVVNLNRFRKKKLREEKAKQAENNRVKHGRTKAEKEAGRVARERDARVLDGARLEPGSDAVHHDDRATEHTEEGDAER